MKVINIDNIKPLKINVKKEFDFPNPTNLPPNSGDIPFFNGLLCGSRGSGKSVLGLELLENLKNLYNKYYVISPTLKTDKKVREFFEGLEDDEKKVIYYEELNEKNLNEILDDLKNDLDLWKKFMKVYTLIEKIKKHGSKNLSDAEINEVMSLLLFEDEDDIDFNDLDNVLDAFPDYIMNPYPPMSMMWIDDCYGCKLLSKSQGSNVFTQYWIKHRHYFVSNLIMVQSISGVPRAIRSNTSLFCAFGVKSNKDRDILYSEVDNIFPNKKDFLELMDQADKEDYGFLYIDSSSVKNPDIRIGLRKKIQL